MKRKLIERVRGVLEAAAKKAKTSQGRYHVEEITLHEKFAEPDYTDPDSGIIALGDWNDVGHYDEKVRKFITDDDIMPRLAHVLEKRFDVCIDWNDQWTECGCCNGLVRTSADCYAWKQHFVELDGEIVCEECLIMDKQKIVSYLKSIEGNCQHAIPLDNIDPEDHGYIKYSEQFENGLHGGQADSPDMIAQFLKSKGITRFLFTLDWVGQFEMEFSVWIHKEHKKLMKGLVIENCHGPDPAEMAQKALREVRHVSDEERGNGVAYTKLNLQDGTSTTRIISPEEFIVNGIGRD